MSRGSQEEDERRVEAILHEWFGELQDDGTCPPERRARWWKKSVAFDEHLRSSHGDDVESALAGECDGWASSPRGALALVLLLDQLTRNLFRGTARMYAGDAKAMKIVSRAIEDGFDAQVPPAYVPFLYMPLMHIEDLAVQNRCVSLFEALAARCAPALAAHTANDLKAARVHRNIIARFGRFPHRNPILGREPTDEERAFLDAGGPSF